MCEIQGFRSAWDIKETGSAVDALFDRWKQDHNLSDEDLAKVVKCFMSQYVYLRDVEIGFQALLPYASPTESFYRDVEINCDLLEVNKNTHVCLRPNNLFFRSESELKMHLHGTFGLAIGI